MIVFHGGQIVWLGLLIGKRFPVHNAIMPANNATAPWGVTLPGSLLKIQAKGFPSGGKERPSRAQFV
jgi:hypothetical protein